MQPTVFDEVFGITNDFLYLSNVKIKYIKYLDITKFRYSEQSVCKSLGSSLYRGFTVIGQYATSRAHAKI